MPRLQLCNGCSGSAVYASKDLGQTWKGSEAVPSARVTQLAQAGDALFALSSEYGPFRYAGDGRWESIKGDLPAEGLLGTHMVVDPASPDRLFVGTQAAGIFHTEDGGRTWTRVDLPGLNEDSFGYPLTYFLAIDPNNNDLIWAGMYRAGGSTEAPLFSPEPWQIQAAGLFRSEDGGNSWIRVWSSGGFRMTIDGSETVAEVYGERSKHYYLTAGGMHSVMRMDTVGDVSYCRTIEGINGVYTNALRFFEDTLYVAGEQGITFTDDPLAGWTYRQPGTSLVYTWDFAMNPREPDVLLWATGEPAWGVAATRGVWRSRLSDCEESVPGCIGVDPPLQSCPKENLLEGIGVWRLETPPGDDFKLYALTQEAGIKVGNGKDEDWEDLSEGLEESSVTCLLFNEGGKPMVAGTRTCRGNYTLTCSWVPNPYTEGGGVYYREGGKWVRGEGLDRAVLDLTRDASGIVLYAGTAVGVFKSTDDGRTWQRASTGMPEEGLERVVRAVVADPRSQGVVYAASFDGVYRTVDGGDSWTKASRGLTNSYTDRLIFVPGAPDRLYVATLGTSVFVAEVIR